MSLSCRRAALWTLLAALFATAAGAQTREQDKLDLLARSSVVQGSGARAFGMGGAFLARPDDATAASWNPAGLSYLRLPEVSFVWAGNSLDSPTRDAVTGEPLVADHRKGNAPDFLAGTYPFALGTVTGAAQLSYQRAISFDGDRTINNLDSLALLQINSKGGFDVLALAIGARVSRRVRVGLTVNRWLNGYDQTKHRSGGPNQPTDQTLTFEFSGWNANMGLIWSPWESLNLGAVYKSGFTADVHMSRTRTDFFADTVSTKNAYDSHNPYQSPLDIRLEFPGALGFGASWRPIDPLTISADYTRSFWSNGRIFNYFTLGATPSNSPSTATPDVAASLPYPTLFPDQQQQDTQQVRAGVEYLISLKGLRWPIRAGLFTDRQLFPARDGRFPRFEGWTAGTGLIVGPVLFDVAFVSESGHYLDPNSSLDQPQTISVTAHKLYVSLIYRHSKKP